MNKTLLYARESVAFDKVLTLVDADGTPIDITGWTFALDLTRQAGSSDLTLDMNPSAGSGGFAIVDGSAGELRMVVLQSALAGIGDTTGDFTLFGDLLGTAPASSPVFVRDIRLNVTVAGAEFAGSSYEVALQSIGAVLKTELAAIVDQAEAEADRAEAAAVDLTFGSQITNGELMGKTTAATSIGGGASASGYRITIPNGSTGNGSTMRARLPVSALPESMKDAAGKLKAGETIRITLVLKTSAPFTRVTSQDIQIQKTDLSSVTRAVAQPLVLKPSDAGAGEWGFDYVAQGDEYELRPRFTLGGNSGAASEEYFEIVSVRATVQKSATSGESRTDRMLGVREAELATKLTSSTGNLVGTDAVYGAGSGTLGGYYSEASESYVIPAGSTANDALISAILRPPYKQWNGRSGIIKVEWNYSDNFNRPPDSSQVDAYLPGVMTATARASNTATITDIPAEKKVIASFPYTFLGDEERLQFALKLNSPGAAAADQEIWLAKVTVEFPGLSDSFFRHADMMLEERMRGMATSPLALRLATPLRAAIYTQVRRVGTGIGDYPTLKAAYDAITKKGPFDHVLIDVGAGDFTSTLQIKHDGQFAVTFKGRGMSYTSYTYDPGDGASASTIENDSAFKIQGTFFLEGMRVFTKNGRYCLHPESDGARRFQNHVWGFNNCEIAHLGNTAPNTETVPNGWNAIGSGTTAGAYYSVTNCYVWAKVGSAFACHNNTNFKEATLVHLFGNTFRAGTASGRALSLGFLQSGRACQLVYGYNTIHGVVQIDSTDGASPISAEDSLHSEIQITGFGNTPHVVYVGDEEAGEDHPYYPRITDEEKELLNTTGATIPRKTLVAYDRSMDAVRPMTSADDPKLFAGVTLQDIPAGERGRVKYKGWLSAYRVVGMAPASFTGSISGNTLTVSAMASGTLEVGDLVEATAVAERTYISALGTGTGGAGTYTLSGAAQSVSATAMKGRPGLFSKSSVDPGNDGEAVRGGAQGLLRAVTRTGVEIA